MKQSHEKKDSDSSGSADKGDMSVHDAGKKGGQRVRELVEEGKQQEQDKEQGKS